jgi:hypothetical protein
MWRSVTFIEAEMNAPDKYWFPAKRYGWGWGLPSSWHGWVVLAVYVSSLAFIVYFFSLTDNVALLGAGVATSTAILLAVCWLKGEPPRWRWGNRERA